jgi:hypothetical protein
MAEPRDIRDARERLRYDTPFWARNCATILTEEKVPVKLAARPWQLEFDRRSSGSARRGCRCARSC